MTEKAKPREILLAGAADKSWVESKTRYILRYILRYIWGCCSKLCIYNQETRKFEQSRIPNISSSNPAPLNIPLKLYLKIYLKIYLRIYLNLNLPSGLPDTK